MAHCWYHIFTKYFPITCTHAQTALRSHYSQIHYSWKGRRQCYLHKHTQLHMRAFKILNSFTFSFGWLGRKESLSSLKDGAVWKAGLSSALTTTASKPSGEGWKSQNLVERSERCRLQGCFSNYKSTSSTSLSTSLSPSLSTSMSNKSGWKWQKRLKSVRGASIKVDYSLPAWLLFLSQ